MRCSTRFIAATVVAAVSLVPLTIAARAAGAQQSLPPALASFLTEEAHATSSDREALLASNPLVKLLDADPSKEIAVLGAIWVNAPRSLYVERVKNIEQFERGGGFRITKRISDPPRADDFAALTISDEDFEDLKDCKIGDCVLKLDADGVRALRAEVDWSKPTAKADATVLFRRLALDYVNGYREGGNARLGIHRDRERPTFVGNEFRSMIERLPRLGAELPDLTRYLLDYPNATLKNSTDFLYWQETEFGLRPTVRISHLVIQERPDQTVVASKMLYASHYFWTALELRVLLPDPARGPGFWLVTVNRSRSDGLSGFTGRMIRGRVRSEVEDGTRAALTATKTRLESKACSGSSVFPPRPSGGWSQCSPAWYRSSAPPPSGCLEPYIWPYPAHGGTIVLAVWGAAVVSSVDNFLRPKLVAGRVRLSGLAMFVAMFGGLQAFGALGIIVGPVVFATASALVAVLRDTLPTHALRVDAAGENVGVTVLKEILSPPGTR